MKDKNISWDKYYDYLVKRYINFSATNVIIITNKNEKYDNIFNQSLNINKLDKKYG